MYIFGTYLPTVDSLLGPGCKKRAMPKRQNPKRSQIANEILNAGCCAVFGCSVVSDSL